MGLKKCYSDCFKPREKRSFGWPDGSPTCTRMWGGPTRPSKWPWMAVFTYQNVVLSNECWKVRFSESARTFWPRSFWQPHKPPTVNPKPHIAPFRMGNSRVVYGTGFARGGGKPCILNALGWQPVYPNSITNCLLTLRSVENQKKPDFGQQTPSELQTLNNKVRQ